MRLLIIPSNFPSPSDATSGIFVLRQVQALQQLGHDAMVFHMVPHALPLNKRWRRYCSVPTEYNYQGVQVNVKRAFIAPRMLGMQYWYRQLFPRVTQIIRSFKPDLIHAHFLIPAGTFAINHDIPVVVTAHGIDAYDWPWRNSAMKAAAEKVVAAATTVVAVSNFIRGQVNKLGGRDVPVVFNGADEEEFGTYGRIEARSQLGIGDAELVIAFGGSIEKTKGIFDLVSAAALLHDLAPLLLIAGNGPEFESLRRALEGRGVRHRLFGAVDQRLMAQIMAASDVVALPSYKEGLPAILCEAMLSGRAIVATDVGGIPEIVTHGETGYVVPVADVSALAEGIRTITQDKQTQLRFELAALKIAKDKLTWRANALAYQPIYSRAIQKFEAARRQPANKA